MLFIVFRKLGRSMKCDTRQTETGLRVFWYVNTACDPAKLSTIWPLTLIYSAEQKISTVKQSKRISRFDMKDIRIHHHHDHYLCPCCLFVWSLLQSTIRQAVLAGCYGDTALHLCLFPSLSHERNAIPKVTFTEVGEVHEPFLPRFLKGGSFLSLSYKSYNRLSSQCSSTAAKIFQCFRFTLCCFLECSHKDRKLWHRRGEGNFPVYFV